MLLVALLAESVAPERFVEWVTGELAALAAELSALLRSITPDDLCAAAAGVA